MDKKAIVFDLDGTLAESKQKIQPSMAALLLELLAARKVSVVSGGGFPQLDKQVVGQLPFDAERFKNLFIFPTKGAAMYRFDGATWQNVYENDLAAEDKRRIRDAFDSMTAVFDFLPKAAECYGEQLEDRGSQMTYSALGQEAPVSAKKDWDPDAAKRQKIRAYLEKRIPGFEIEIGGSTSIDITKRGIDKAYALEQLCAHEGMTIADILYIGDAIFPGGNDYAVVKTGVDTIRVKDYHETETIIRNIIDGTL